MLVDGLDHRLQGERVPPRQFLQFLVEGMMKQVVVDVPHQVEMALLLVAGDRIIGSVEVRDEDASEVSKGLLEEGSFPGRMIEVDDDLRARERPDVTDASECLILIFVSSAWMSIPDRNRFQHLIHSDSVNLSQASLSTLSDPATVTSIRIFIYA